MSNGTDTLLSAEDVAAAFDVPRATVTRWARTGKLPAIKTIGGHWRFRAADVERHVRELQRFQQAAS